MPFLKRLHEYKVQGKIHPEKETEEGRKEVTENFQFTYERRK
jgi:hypothetical protein